MYALLHKVDFRVRDFVDALPCYISGAGGLSQHQPLNMLVPIRQRSETYFLFSRFFFMSIKRKK